MVLCELVQYGKGDRVYIHRERVSYTYTYSIVQQTDALACDYPILVLLLLLICLSQSKRSPDRI